MDIVQPEDAENDLVKRHEADLNEVHGALISLLLAPNSSPESVAKELHMRVQKLTSDTMGLLTHVLRKAAVDILKGGIQDPSQPNSSFSNALAIVDCAIVLVHERHVDERLPCLLMEFVFTFCTRGQLANGVDEIRQRFAAYRAAALSTRTHIYLIKAAMSCINRDQKGSDPALSGRLRLMLAAALPVWHPSGLNRRGQFNEGSEIDYESALKEGDFKDVDVDLYKSFWGVQRFMQNPSLAETEDIWVDARLAMDAVLGAFETLAIPEEPSIVLESPSPKYMTAPSVLHLQLVDIRVRRHVLVQFAIFLHHLEVISDTIPSEKDSPAVQKKHAFCKSLFASGGEGQRAKDRVYALLERDSAGKFKRFIVSLLQRERRWIDWKKRAGYKHLNETRSEPPKTFKRRRVLSPVPGSTDSAPKRKQESGPEEWKLRQASWKVLPRSERMAPFKDPQRSLVPSVETLKDQLKEDMEDPDITEDVKRKNDTKFVWRSLRMLCEESLETLMQVIDTNSKTGYDLELCVKGKTSSSPAGEPTAESVEVK